MVAPTEASRAAVEVGGSTVGRDGGVMHCRRPEWRRRAKPEPGSGERERRKKKQKKLKK